MPQSPVEEIKARLDITDFIGTYVPLKRAGTNFKACCPFHSEKTPSFMVSKPKQLWYCFGACNEGGDVFKFLMKIEGLDFPEALKILADKAGVVLPRYDKQAESKKNTLLEIVKAAVEFYAQQINVGLGLVPSRGGAQGPALQGAQLAREYLIKRGLSDAVIKQFALGYAPDSWDALALFLRDKFKAEDVFAAGLTIKRTTDYGLRTTESAVVGSPSAVDRYYDRFRHRIMFPIRDIHGQAVGFTSRLLDEKRQEGKYVNTPETLIYSKSRVLYGLDLAREAIRKQDYAVLVEGNMDVIACHQFGQTNVVAASGTALTLDQVRILQRYTNNLKIAFDADPAGENAAKRGIDLALGAGLRIKVITLPKECGKDPDECLRKNVKAWENAVREAKEIMEYYLEKARAKFDIKTAHGRSQFVNTLLIELVKFPDLVEQDFWLKKIGETVKVDERVLREQMKRIHNPPQPSLTLREGDRSVPPLRVRGGEEGLRSTRPRSELLSDRLLALFFRETKCAEIIIGTVLPEILAPKQNQELYMRMVECYNAFTSQLGSALAGANFRQFWRNWAKNTPEFAHMISTADILELLGDKEFDAWDLTQLQREAHFLASSLRREHLRERRGELAEAMRQAEAHGDQARVSALAQEFEALSVSE